MEEVGGKCFLPPEFPFRIRLTNKPCSYIQTASSKQRAWRCIGLARGRLNWSCCSVHRWYQWFRLMLVPVRLSHCLLWPQSCSTCVLHTQTYIPPLELHGTNRGCPRVWQSLGWSLSQCLWLFTRSPLMPGSVWALVKGFTVDGGRVVPWTNNLPCFLQGLFKLVLLFLFCLQGPLITSVLHLNPDRVTCQEMWMVKKRSYCWALHMKSLQLLLWCMEGYKVSVKFIYWLACDLKQTSSIQFYMYSVTV